MEKIISLIVSISLIGVLFFGHVEEKSKTRQEAKVKNNKIAMYVEMGPGTGV
ncbi:hypothetical protein [Bacillus thuringiensis]|uniref:hypothetical protein n=1 Tax=Bacillus thuringiensis TaxID=1428 RepID=UPI001642A8B0|nr:hypothetical protein [Bacillus thuringiensis]